MQPASPVTPAASTPLGAAGAAASAPAAGRTSNEAVGGATQAWQDQVFARIAAGEYAVRAEGARLGASTRAQGLRTAWSERGHVEVWLARGSGARRPLQLATEAIARGSQRIAAREGAFVLGACQQDGARDASDACLRRAELVQAGWVEWWENRSEGLEQGYDLERAPFLPAGDAPLRIELRVTDARVAIEVAGDGASFELADGETLRYGQLAAHDADHRALPIRFAPHAGGLAIEVDDRAARYPISIDPLLSQSAWPPKEINQANAHFGVSVASAGDVDADGYGDVIVGADLYDNGTASDQGRAYLFRGGPSGLATTAAWDVGPTGGGTNTAFGKSVAGAGDLNGDGYGDVVVGAHNLTNGETMEGRVFVYSGGSYASGGPGLSKTPRVLESNSFGAHFGWSVAAAGDVNNDRYADLVVGAPWADGPLGSDEGAVYVFHGGSGGIATTPAKVLRPNRTGAYLGYSVAGAGDVNGDGFGDVIAGAYAYSNGYSNEGAAFVYVGGTSGLADNWIWHAEGEQQNAFYGTSVASAGDVNADGFSDVIVGADRFDGGQGSVIDGGKAFMYKGGVFGPSVDRDWSMEASAQGARFGASVASAGDINGDGYGDVVIGSPEQDPSGATNAGRATVYFGGGSNLQITASAGAVFNGPLTSGFFGSSVACAGDVNGDGYSDVIVGAHLSTNGQTAEGRAYLYLGAPGALSGFAGSSPEGTDDDARFGSSVAGAGDVNGDGYGDVIVGAYQHGSAGGAFVFHGGPGGLATTASFSATPTSGAVYFGWEVSGAGDVNGDGYADVLVSDHGDSSVQASAQVYFGTASGVSLTSPAPWKVTGPFGFASSIASAGDVNGDGYGDVVLTRSTDRSALVYYGGANGLPATPSRTLVGVGGWAEGAGDVNRDGYDDLIVGDSLFSSNQGRILMYHGASSGIPANATTTLPSGGANLWFGERVGSAGDVNGDGYGDVVVTDQHDRCYALPGSASGVTTPVLWVGVAMFHTCASAGDVNGDSYGDLVTTDPSGMVSVYYGGATGAASSAAWSTTAGEGFGISVGSAGDVNGDGYGDVFVGVPYYQDPSSSPRYTRSGRAQVFLGNDAERTGGAAVLPLSRRHGQTRAIVPGARAASTVSFDPALVRARGPMGRNWVRVQFEVKAIGAAFNGSGTITTGWNDAGLTGAQIWTEAAAASYGTAPHWRARMHYRAATALPWFQRSRWIYGGASGAARMANVRVR